MAVSALGEVLAEPMRGSGRSPDWTDFDADGHSTLALNMITWGSVRRSRTRTKAQGQHRQAPNRLALQPRLVLVSSDPQHARGVAPPTDGSVWTHRACAGGMSRNPRRMRQTLDG